MVRLYSINIQCILIRYDSNLYVNDSVFKMPYNGYMYETLGIAGFVTVCRHKS